MLTNVITITVIIANSLIASMTRSDCTVWLFSALESPDDLARQSWRHTHKCRRRLTLLTVVKLVEFTGLGLPLTEDQVVCDIAVGVVGGLPLQYDLRGRVG